MTNDEAMVLSCAQQIQQYCAEHNKACKRNKQRCIFFAGLNGNSCLLDETPELWCLELARGRSDSNDG